MPSATATWGRGDVSLAALACHGTAIAPPIASATTTPRLLIARIYSGAANAVKSRILLPLRKTVTSAVRPLPTARWDRGDVYLEVA
jgi:hypothetical protein